MASHLLLFRAAMIRKSEMEVSKVDRPFPAQFEPIHLSPAVAK